MPVQCLKHQNYITSIIGNQLLNMECMFYIQKGFRINYVIRCCPCLTHKHFEKAVDPGTTSRLTRRKKSLSWVHRRAHQLFCLVNRPVVLGSTRPSPEQNLYVYLHFFFSILLDFKVKILRLFSGMVGGGATGRRFVPKSLSRKGLCALTSKDTGHSLFPLSPTSGLPSLTSLSL